MKTKIRELQKMKKLSIFLTSVLLIAGILTTSVTVYAAENLSTAVTTNEAVGFHGDQELIAAKELAKKLDGQFVEISAQYGVDGKFFGSVTSKEIAGAIESKFGISVDKRKIETPEIKKCGSFDIKINLYTGVVCKMTVVVE